MVKKTFLGLLVLLLAIQFIRQSKNLGAVLGPSDIQVRHPASSEVRRLLASITFP
jgi:hypothetical protein